MDFEELRGYFCILPACPLCIVVLPGTLSLRDHSLEDPGSSLLTGQREALRPSRQDRPRASVLLLETAEVPVERAPFLTNQRRTGAGAP